MAELADALDLGSSALKACRFKSCSRHQKNDSWFLVSRLQAPASRRKLSLDAVAGFPEGICVVSDFNLDGRRVLTSTSTAILGRLRFTLCLRSEYSWLPANKSHISSPNRGLRRLISTIRSVTLPPSHLPA